MTNRRIEFYASDDSSNHQRPYAVQITIDTALLSPGARNLATCLVTTVRRPHSDDDALFISAINTNRQLRRDPQKSSEYDAMYPGLEDTCPETEWDFPILYLTPGGTEELQSAEAITYLERTAAAINRAGGDLQNVRGPFTSVQNGEAYYVDEQALALREQMIEALFGRR